MSAIGLKITNPYYSNMVFHSTLTEYPKWVKMEGYPDAIAKDAEDEAALLARPMRSKGDTSPVQERQASSSQAAEPVPSVVLTGRNDEMEILLQIAAEKGIKIDKRWNIARVRATIERETAGL